MAQDRRRKKKGQALTTLEIRCESWDEFAALYANDISLGGIYIETENQPPVLSTVGIKLLLPEGHEVEFKGNVVHVASAEEAEAEGRAEGVGLEFRNLDPMMKKQLWHLVEYAKWEAGAPGARSYAAALMEFAETQAAAGADSEAWTSLSPPPIEDEDFGPADDEYPDGETEPDEVGALTPEKRVTVPAPPSYEDDARASTSIPAPPLPSDLQPSSPPPVRGSPAGRAEPPPPPPPSPRRPSVPEESPAASAPPAPPSPRPSVPEPGPASSAAPPPAYPSHRPSTPEYGSAGSAPAPARGQSGAPAAARSVRPQTEAAEARRSVRPASGRATEAARKLAASLRSKNQGAGSANKGAGAVAPAPAAGGAARGVRVSKTASTISREKVGVAFKDIAYKRYDMAIRTLEEVVTKEPDNKKARIWLNIARARRAVQQGKRRDAVRFFGVVLELDDQNHEAQKFVKAYERDEKVKNVPFARYFTKKQ